MLQSDDSSELEAPQVGGYLALILETNYCNHLNTHAIQLVYNNMKFPNYHMSEDKTLYFDRKLPNSTFPPDDIF